MEKSGDESDIVDSKSETHLQKSNRKQSIDDLTLYLKLNLQEVLQELDGFLEKLSSSTDVVPESVESLVSLVDSMISKLEFKDTSCKFGSREEDLSFLQGFEQLTRLVNGLREVKLSSALVSCLNRSSLIHYRGILFLDDEFRFLLDSTKRPINNNNNNNNNNVSDKKGTPKAQKSSSFSFRATGGGQEPDRCVLQESETTPEEDQFHSFSPDSISAMNKIATAMISAGYEPECSLIYLTLRRQSFKDELTRLGFENLNVEEIQKLQWDTLEGEIANWINIIKHCSTELFPNERSLNDSVFSDHPALSKRLFSDLASAVTIRFLDFSSAVVLTKRSTEKLFKFLDMYETIRDLIPKIDESDRELITEIYLALNRLGQASLSIFSDLENSIKSDNGRTPVPSGTVHPLTRYTMNYLKYACEYKDTLEQVFLQMMNENGNIPPEPETITKNEDIDDRSPKTSPFSIQLMTIMGLLDANLDMKSKLYRDPALRYIFLMNNGRYILQKIKGSQEIHDMMGQSVTRKRSTDIRQYHNSYKRETWSKVLQCMNPEGIQVHGKVSKNVLKERFKCFNAMFDEIHKVQSTWVVSDEQLQSELRISITAVVIPAYRSFLGRFKQHFDAGRQTEKYIKYQPEDVETMIEELFDGNRSSMGRRRT